MEGDIEKDGVEQADEPSLSSVYAMTLHKFEDKFN